MDSRAHAAFCHVERIDMATSSPSIIAIGGIIIRRLGRENLA